MVKLVLSAYCSHCAVSHNCYLKGWFTSQTCQSPTRASWKRVSPEIAAIHGDFQRLLLDAHYVEAARQWQRVLLRPRQLQRALRTLHLEATREAMLPQRDQVRRRRSPMLPVRRRVDDEA